jgi:hypothetical protein
MKDTPMKEHIRDKLPEPAHLPYHLGKKGEETYEQSISPYRKSKARFSLLKQTIEQSLGDREGVELGQEKYEYIYDDNTNNYASHIKYSSSHCSFRI